MSTEKGKFTGVAILREGTFRSSAGRKVVIDSKMLRTLVANHDPSEFVPGVNKDHVNSGPRFGDITNLRVDGNILKADIDNVPAAFAQEMLIGGGYPYRSVEIRDMKVRGLAALGARPPAIKNLARITPDQYVPLVAFSENDQDEYTEFAEVEILQEEPVPDTAITATQFAEMQKKMDDGFAELKTELSERDEEIIKLSESLKDEQSKNAKFIESEARNQLELAEQKRESEVTKFMSKIENIPDKVLETTGVANILKVAKQSDVQVEVDGESINLSSAIEGLLLAIPSDGFPVGEIKGKVNKQKGDINFGLSKDEINIADMFAEANDLSEDEAKAYKDELRKEKALNAKENPE